MSITIKDIAKKAGVSPSTVSRTINNHYSISEETKEKVRKVMDELGYVYDKSHIKKHDVGVVFPRSMVDVYENPFYLEIVRGISYMCNKGRYSLHIITGADTREMKTSMEIADCEGYIFLNTKIESSVTDYLRERMIPYIMIGKPPMNSITSVSVVSAPGEDSAYLSQGENVINSIISEQSTDVDTISGATFSSTGILEAVNDALSKAENA